MERPIQISPRPKRSWSQNFIIDRSITRKVADEVAEAAADGPVLELGAGTGALTRELAGRCSRVFALERDRDLVPVLREEFRTFPNVRVLEANALSIDIGSLASEETFQKICVAGNLPYHIASQIIFHLLDERASVSSFILMLQKEMAVRVVSGPGTKEYGVISVLCALHTRPRLLFHVAPGAFRPKPKVESSVVRFDVLAVPAAEVPEESVFKRVVKAAFNQRRKTLRNALKPLTEDLGAIDAALKDSGIDSVRRGETLTLSEFALLASVLGRLIGGGQG